ncbi:elongation factor G [Streptomyces aureoverticillatus]|uniref:elongation factor G n=1 Tax=Streptomyces aureoverticillatus TaxID=66871 RepID=UPI0013D92F9F|nr:TetM/TetW/TetO/TetS family tetracycline resistance ribosomal protection protein [Streptomyces aureoverticillatus]QIB43629.1 TetM/TetW/TetO/TetS family tetracycline resistance ribosomal protection protein [Streptomyces aureoverticillatus]
MQSHTHQHVAQRQEKHQHALNLGILAHIDAGKTSLTERLLHSAGVIDEVGSVDDGSTQTDSLALERQRGITIKSAVVSFAIDDVTVNLIDTPGHPDFIAEVERVLSVLDGAVLVVSAVEGVQAQTRVLMRTLRRLAIPTLVFVNKVDRRGAGPERVLAELATRLTPAVAPMGTVRDPGTRAARYVPYAADDPRFTARLAELLAEHDDALLSAYVDGDAAALSFGGLRDVLTKQTRRARFHPVFFGSAMTGTGLDALTGAVKELLPAAAGGTDGPVAGTVFKVERGPAGEKVAYARMFSGTVRVRDRVPLAGHAEDGKVTAVSVFEQGAAVRRDAVAAGQIAKLWGLTGVRIGDVLGDARAVPERHAVAHHFAPPTLETVVVPRHAADRAALHAALTQLAEQDPLIDLRQDTLRQEISVSLYGEVQKEVIEATLADEFGVGVEFRETTTICVERVAGAGEHFEIIDTDPNPFLATVGLRVEAAPVGAGVEFRLGVELGSMPYAFFKAVEETVKETLGQGLHGWEVPDCVVTMTRSGYWPRQSHAHAVFDKSMSSTAGDFRQLTPLVLMDALRRAGTRVHEPMHRFRLTVPADVFGTLLPALGRLRAVPHTPAAHGSAYVVDGVIPAARVHDLEQALPGLTRGEGELESAFDHYAPVTGTPPARPRTDHNPLDRKEYVQRVTRRTRVG